MLNCIKFVLILAIIIVCSILGYKKANVFSNREIELRNLKNGLQIFESRIRFSYLPIPEIFAEISKVVYSNEKNIFNDTIVILNVNKHKSISDAWNEAIAASSSNLKKEDNEILKMLSNLLGKTDRDGQIAEIEVTKEYLETQIAEAIEEKRKNMKLYKTLGTVIGCSVGILML